MHIPGQDHARNCERGNHAWEPLAAEPGRRGFTRYHCRVCGESSVMQDSAPAPGVSLDDRFAALEARLAAMDKRLHDFANMIMALQLRAGE
jgi:uncharacterized protein YceH (UPF0502 family)